MQTNPKIILSDIIKAVVITIAVLSTAAFVSVMLFKILIK